MKITKLLILITTCVSLGVFAQQLPGAGGNPVGGIGDIGGIGGNNAGDSEQNNSSVNIYESECNPLGTKAEREACSLSSLNSKAGTIATSVLCNNGEVVVPEDEKVRDTAEGINSLCDDKGGIAAYTGSGGNIFVPPSTDVQIGTNFNSAASASGSASNPELIITFPDLPIIVVDLPDYSGADFNPAGDAAAAGGLGGGSGSGTGSSSGSGGMGS